MAEADAVVVNDTFLKAAIDVVRKNSNAALPPLEEHRWQPMPSPQQQEHQQQQQQSLALSSSFSSSFGPSSAFLAAPAAIRFCHVLVDEAAQATEPSCLVPLKFGAEKLILVGDPRQLPGKSP